MFDGFHGNCAKETCAECALKSLYSSLLRAGVLRMLVCFTLSACAAIGLLSVFTVLTLPGILPMNTF